MGVEREAGSWVGERACVFFDTENRTKIKNKSIEKKREQPPRPTPCHSTRAPTSVAGASASTAPVLRRQPPVFPKRHAGRGRHAAALAAASAVAHADR